MKEMQQWLYSYSSIIKQQKLSAVARGSEYQCVHVHGNYGRETNITSLFVGETRIPSDTCVGKHASLGSSHGFFFFHLLCAVKLRVLSLMAYWYTGSAFHQIPKIIFIIHVCGEMRFTGKHIATVDFMSVEKSRTE